MVKKRNQSEQERADNTPELAVKAEENAPDTAADLDAPEVDQEEEITELDPLEALKAEADKNLDGWQRTLAEFQNYRRRVTREQQELRKKVTLETLSSLLPIIDDFERALANIPEEMQGDAWVDGVALIKTKFLKLLEEHDIEVLDPVGEEFNPNHHQAIGTGESDQYESGHVVETLQKGYLSGKILLRPALVTVAS